MYKHMNTGIDGRLLGDFGPGLRASSGVGGFSISKPITDFTADDTTVTTGQLVTLTITNGGGAASSGVVDWGEGDGQVALVSPFTSATHTFSSAGDYWVSVILINAGGSDAEVKSNYITVSAAGSPFSLTIPVSGTFVLTAAGNATLTLTECYGKGDVGSQGGPAAAGDGGVSGYYCSEVNKSVASGDFVTANMFSNYCYLTDSGSVTICGAQSGGGDGTNVGSTIKAKNAGGVASVSGGGGGGGGTPTKSGAGTVGSDGGLLGVGGTGGLDGDGSASGGKGGSLGPNAGTAGKSPGAGGGGGGLDASNPAGGAPGNQRMVLTGTTAGTGFTCPTAIYSITNSGGSVLITTVGPHGLSSGDVTVSGTGLAEYDSNYTEPTFPTATTILTSTPFTVALGTGNTSAAIVVVGQVQPA